MNRDTLFWWAFVCVTLSAWPGYWMAKAVMA